VALLVGVAAGPRPSVEDAWVEPSIGADVDAYLTERERAVAGIRPGEAKSVLWADSARRTRTPLSLVYLHGFSADRHEVEPLMSDLARELGANVYFARLSGHAIGGEALGEASAADWLRDAAEAVAVGGKIGERVVLVGTSTGGTLALWAATRPESQGRVAALVLVSPNLGLRDPAARALTWPWGGLIARVVAGRERCFEPAGPEEALHWTVCYPTRALLPMAALVAHVRGLDLSSVRAPTLAVYSRDDQVVDARQTERVLAELGGRASRFVLERSGDPANHVVAGAIMSPATTDLVRSAVVAFLEHAGLLAPAVGRSG
jgi:esterase/lipase